MLFLRCGKIEFFEGYFLISFEFVLLVIFFNIFLNVKQNITYVTLSLSQILTYAKNNTDLLPSEVSTSKTYFCYINNKMRILLSFDVNTITKRQ